MPADGVLDINLAYGRGALRSVHLFAVPDIAAAVTAELAAAGPQARVCVLAESPQTIPFVAAQVPMPAGGVR